jgi:hypothetical protein
MTTRMLLSHHPDCSYYIFIDIKSAIQVKNRQERKVTCLFYEEVILIT